MRLNKPWLTVDPGISGTGLAVLDGTKLLRYQNVYPDSRCKTWEQRSSSIISTLHQILPRHFWRVYIEWPTQFTGAKGLAASNSNDILKLACLIGRITQMFTEHGASVVTLPVQKWKGNLPKPVVAARAESFFGLKKFTLKMHMADAVGIARYVLKEGGYRGR